MTWNMPTHKLRWPMIGEGGEKVTEIKLRALTVAEHREAIESAGPDADDDDHFEALLLAASGLPATALVQIKRPDYVSLVKIMHEYVTMPASYFLGVKVTDPDDAPLLVPIKAQGRVVERLPLQVPTLFATKAMRKLKTSHERTDFISSHCTGITPVELLQLSLPDWTQLQGRLNDFLNKPADYFPLATSK
ncbi:phage tail assembly protein [Pseudomonas aeruginosa]|uniref:phage tail assembly protein n=1 Tax=Pseudomonas aeruginosa TaxID=287 RepID=UPI003891C92D